MNDALPIFTPLSINDLQPGQAAVTTSPVSGASQVAVSTQPTNWLGTISNWISSAGQLIQQDAGAVSNAYKNITAAAGVVSGKSTPSQTQAAPAPVSLTNPSTWPSWAVPALAAGGLLILLILARRAR